MCRTVNNIPVTELSKRYNVSRAYIYKMGDEGKSDEEIMAKIKSMTSIEYRMHQLFLKYVSVYLKKILIVFDDPTERKKVKQEYFTLWEEHGLPISIDKIENGWNIIQRGAY